VCRSANGRAKRTRRVVSDDSVPPLADELDPGLFGVVDHVDGPMLKVGDLPLCYFEDDTEPSIITGQGDDDFFVVSPDGRTSWSRTH
jgi:hypothetical protein